MPNLPKVPTFFTALAAFLTASAAPGFAAGWTAGAERAGLSADGGETIAFTCGGTAPGTLRLIFAGFDASLQPNLDYTVVVTVDGTAYRQTTRAVPGSKGRDLVQALPTGQLLPLVDALAAGSKAEIASPAGRESLSLKGSGKALKALKAACR